MTWRHCCAGCACRTIRAAAPDVLATAKAQRWDPAEVLRVLLAEEVAGRDRSALATRRAAAGFPTGKTFDVWDPERVQHPRATQTGAAHPGMDPPPREPGGLRAIRHRQDVPARSPRPARRQAGLHVAWLQPGGPRRSCYAATAPTTPWPKPSPGSCKPNW